MIIFRNLHPNFVLYLQYLRIMSLELSKQRHLLAELDDQDWSTAHLWQGSEHLFMQTTHSFLHSTQILSAVLPCMSSTHRSSKSWKTSSLAKTLNICESQLHETSVKKNSNEDVCNYSNKICKENLPSNSSTIIHLYYWKWRQIVIF